MTRLTTPPFTKGKPPFLQVEFKSSLTTLFLFPSTLAPVYNQIDA